jgi:BMFP domain-containing protein YqiC
MQHNSIGKKLMIDTNKIDDLVRKLSEAFPPGFKTVEAEVKKQFRAILESGLTKMDFVSREEFDIQTKVLAKTREKIDLLEQKLSQLESPE